MTGALEELTDHRIEPGQPSINKAWAAFLAHFPAILLIWVVSIAVSALGALVYFLASMLGLAAAGGAEADSAAAIGLLLGQIGQLPFSILSSLVSVLLIAVPAMHYATGEIITVRQAFKTLLRRPWRYLLAGFLFSFAMGVGLVLCILPGIAIALTGPIYVNRIFNTEAPVLEAFSSSFQVVYRSSEGRSFAGLQLLVWLIVVAITLFTCGLGALVAVPVSTFYLQNAAYAKGLIRSSL
ncbi:MULTISPECIES: hypothetical protein [Synechococcales]|uniref:hypothetical protein n=1 Tax=Synechococcus sp. CS-1324 TaxID=2847980 RepID=UPI00223B12EF|nr:hypothetical protein [Synechococcus sp. CS-1324]